MSEMIEELTAATEGSAYPFAVALTDSAGSALSPTTCTWTLLDQYGAVVNSRLNVAMTPATSMPVVLLSADLVCADSDYNARILTIKATYTSSYGVGLTLNKEYLIPVSPLQGA
jgi:hypothetical protein